MVGGKGYPPSEFRNRRSFRCHDGAGSCQGPCWCPHWWPSIVRTGGHGFVSSPGLFGMVVLVPVWGLLGRAVGDRTMVLGAGQGVAQRPSGAKLALCAGPRFGVRPLGYAAGKTKGSSREGRGSGGRSPRRHVLFAGLRLVRVQASRMRNDSPSATTTLAWCSSRSSRLVAVTCSGRNRPHCSKGQWEAMPRARRS
jgi:hypothetical protein